MTIKPIGDFVVLRVEHRGVTPAGIILPAPKDQGTCEGEVIAVGQGRHTEKGVLVPPSVKVGDRVICGNRVGMKVDGSEYVFTRESQILAVI